MSESKLAIVFDGPPGPQSGRFVEVERDGHSIALGTWRERPDGLWDLVIPDHAVLEARLAELERDRWVLWEGDESEGRWRCLMCGEKREGDEDTGPEGVGHLAACGSDGQEVWIYARLAAADALAGRSTRLQGGREQ